MKTFKTLILVAIAASFFVISSCDKDDDPVNKKALITANSWKISAMTIDPPIDFLGIQISDMYAMMDACTKDDLMTFNEDGTYQVTEGATKCDESDPDISESGTWGFNADETQITQTNTESTTTFNVLSITSSKLKFSMSETEEGVTYLYSIEMVPGN